MSFGKHHQESLLRLVEVFALFVVVVEEIYQVLSGVNIFCVEDGTAVASLVWAVDFFDDSEELSVCQVMERDTEASDGGTGIRKDGSLLVHLVHQEIIMAELLELELILGWLWVAIGEFHQFELEGLRICVLIGEQLGLNGWIDN